VSDHTFEVALRVAAALDAAGVEYLVGGSMASSMAGEPRSTLDIDLVVRLSESHVPKLVEELGDEFVADPESLLRAIRQRSSANLIHMSSALKVDLFILGATPFENGQMRRRRLMRVATNPDRFLYAYTPEDILLQKLRWYRMGNQVSERQWRDVLSVLRISGATLDQQYLREGASAFEVTDLLTRAIAEVNEKR
jgi:hypothetical protein